MYLGCQNISEIQVRCHNSESGCTWTGIIGTLQGHLKSCSLEVARIGQVKDCDCRIGQVKDCDCRIGQVKDCDCRIGQVKDCDCKLMDSVPDHLRDFLSLKEGNGFIITKLNQMKFSKKPFLSKPFHSSQGYRLIFMVSPYGCGCGLGTHLTVAIGILTGPNDSKLHWPFVGEVTVVLMNQLSNESHYSKKLKCCENEEKAGRPGGRACMDMCYVALSRLEHDSNNCTQYLKDDTLYFKVIIQ